jgi:hypothetical protein
MVARRMRDCAPGGGFIIAPTHSIRPEVPWDNIRAFYDAVERYGVPGRYSRAAGRRRTRTRLKKT